MSQRFVAMCPGCETRFNVSQSQLAAAAGAVRCGACLRVFQADEQLMPDANQDVYTQEIKPLAEEADSRDLFVDSAANEPNLESSIDIQNDPVIETRLPIEGLDGILDGHDAGPQDIAGQPATAQTRFNSHWAVLAVLLIASLALQYLWFQRLPLAQDAGWRPYYLLVCRYVNCNLTEFNDLTQLSAVDLLVRSHPDLPAALAVEAMLKNDAAYRQKYPRLRLNFMDKSGRPVAARTFAAADYLGGELRGVRMIPAKTKVRLSLAVIDPGPDATNYTIQVVP